METVSQSCHLASRVSLHQSLVAYLDVVND